MENGEANHLPEVDSLPDGFVDSSTESQASSTPTLDHEKPVGGCKNGSDLKHDCSSEKIPDFEGNESQTSQDATEKTDELKTSHVPLSDSESAVVVHDTVNVVSETSAVVSGSSEGNEHVQGTSSERQSEGSSRSVTQASDATEISVSESIESQKGKKLETTEAKRKNTKRIFKSEKEFLEFTLKYQQVLTERDTAITVRDKLESLCRELQRQNKMLMDECKRVSTEGQTLRLDLSNKFQDAIKDVSNKLDEQKEESLAQLRENEMLTKKLKHLAEQYSLSEQQHAQKLKQKTLELQIADLKLKQHEEKLIQEQSQMKIYAEQVSQLLATEKHLRSQLTADGEKFQQFQDALVKSNEVFETFKQEIEKMTKSIKELKKENTFLKRKCEKSDVTLIELVEEREKMKKQLERTKNQKEKLELLCRSLQAERKQNSTQSNSSDSIPT